MYGTAKYARDDVRPGMRVKFQGKEWVASANSTKGLYLQDLMSRIRVTDAWIDVYLDKHGKAAGEYYRQEI
jgi:hypothetical protein